MNVAQETLIKLEVTPEQVNQALSDENSGNGFMNKELKIAIDPDESTSTITYNASYDGEGELLATVTSKPEEVTMTSAESILTEYFEGLDDEEDEEEDEDEE